MEDYSKFKKLEKPIPLTERGLPPEMIERILQNVRKKLKESRDKNEKKP